MSEILPDGAPGLPRLRVPTPEERAAQEAAWDALSPEAQAAKWAETQANLDRFDALSARAMEALERSWERHRAEWGHPPEREDPTTPPGWHTLENRR